MGRATGALLVGGLAWLAAAMGCAVAVPRDDAPPGDTLDPDSRSTEGAARGAGAGAPAATQAGASAPNASATAGESDRGPSEPAAPSDDGATDRAPQDITGLYPGRSLGALTLCEGDLDVGDAVVPMIDVTVVVSQTADLATATVRLQDTGSAWLDGVSVTAPVERQWVRGGHDEVVDGHCPVLRTYAVDIDFEHTNWGGTHPLFGRLDVTETLQPGCADASTVCLHALQAHLMPR